MEYQRKDLPIWVQAWLEVKPPVLVFIAKKTDEGPFLVDGNDAAKKAFKQWTGSEIPVLEQVEEHRKADLATWAAVASGELSKISSLALFKEEIAGVIHETTKIPIPISEQYIVVLTRPI